ncbi:MAG: glycosyltransferase [Candidatus Brocadiales bacterium]|nr:glycosyltransferase [Candidatus Brocadiales bacterium]
MKILVLWKALVSETYHKRFIELAKFRDVELTLVMPTKWGNTRLENEYCSEYNIIPRKIVLNGFNHLHWYPGLAKIIRRVMPDILHIEEEHYSIVTYQAIRLAKKNNIKCMFVSLQNIYKTYPFPFSWMEGYNLKNADYAVAVSDEIRNVLMRKGFAKEQIPVIPYGVDHLMYRAIESQKLKSKLGLDSFTIGFTGRFVKEKGVVDLLKAVSRINKNFNLLLVGSGKLRHKIEVEGRRLEISEKIRFIDYIPSSQVPYYLNCMDCLVLPSRTTKKWKEQFGRVLIEAMSCEVPVIGSDSGEIPNVIGDCGLIFKEGDVDDLSSKIKLLIDNIDLRMELAKKGRQRVLDNFTQKVVARETYKVYQKMMCLEKVHNSIQAQNASDTVHLRWMESLGLQKSKGLNVLDLGCGSGYLCRKFSKEGYGTVIGVDIKLPVDQDKGGEGLQFLQIDLNQKDWVLSLLGAIALERFDLILAFDIIEHLNAPIDFLKKVKKILSDSGSLVLTTPNTNSWERLLFPKTWSGARDTDHLTLFNVYSLQFLLQRAGFLSVHIHARINKLGPLASLFPDWGGQILSLNRKNQKKQ